MNPADKLAAALWEADRHVETIREALAEWDKAPASDWQSLEADRGLVRLVDQLLFRFIKLQDVLGERLVPATYSLLTRAAASAARYSSSLSRVCSKGVPTFRFSDDPRIGREAGRRKPTGRRWQRARAAPMRPSGQPAVKRVLAI